MKKVLFSLFLTFFIIDFTHAQVGVNTVTPNAMLDIKASNQATPANTDGILIPKIDAFPAIIPTAAQQGMMVYLTTTVGPRTPGFYYWDNTSTSWIGVGSNTANAWGLSGNSGTTAGTNYVGTTDDQDVVFKRFNVTSGRIGTNNTSYGNNALASNSGSQLTAIGLNALQSNTSGSGNTAVGRSALSGNTIGSSNTAVGRNSLLSNSTGDSNTSIGASTLGANTTGSANTANGTGALGDNTIGSENTAVGNAALRANIDGISNTSIGMESMFRNISGNNNSATGKFALANNISGSSNSAFGRASLIENTTGSFNTASGQSSLADNTTGSNNTATGYQALRSNTVGSENTALGYLSDVGSTNLTNATSIGARAEVTVSNALVLGSINGVNSATSGVNVGIGTTAPADRLHVVGNIRMVDGNQAAGKVFTSDANGTATWQTPAAAGTTLDGAYDFGGSGVGSTITADAGAVTIAGTDGLVSTGTLGSGSIMPSGIGTRMVWNPRKAAFRAGRVLTTQWDDASVGDFSVAFGGNTIASGPGSTSFGILTNATGSNSIAFGNATTASGSISTAFGSSNFAPSYGETVFGIGATTYTISPLGATRFGAANETDRLFVVGNAIDTNNNLVLDVGERSDALVILKNGLTRLPSTTNAMITASDGKAVVTKEYLAANTSGTLDQAYDFGGAGAGRTITADTGAVTIAGTDGLVSTGTSGSGAVAPSGAGTRMVWNPNKAAFRAGNVTATQWDDANIGIRSMALGAGGLASGSDAVSLGNNTRATGNSSTAFGVGTEASGSGSTAFGSSTIASSLISTAFGSSTIASGARSTAFGFDNTAPSFGETVLGIGATTYTPSGTGAFNFRAVNSTDRLLVVGNAIDFNSNAGVEAVERSDALVILKNGLTRLPSTTIAMIGASDGKAVVTKEYLAATTFGTLDEAYDFGGAGAGRTITADAGAVTIAGTDGLVVSGNSGFGVAAPVARAQLQTASSATKTLFTQALANSGLLITTDFVANNFTPGLFWNTSNNNITKPKAGLFLRETTLGTFMHFGTSNSYATGITNDAVVIDPDGNVGVGVVTPLTTMDVLGALTLRDDGSNIVLTIDNQLISVNGRGHIRLSSNDLVATNRTIGLSDGAVIGQLLIIENADSGLDSFEVQDDAVNRNTNTSGSRAMGPGDIIMLMWTGNFWSEVSYANN